jgi:hypothetical protein
VARVTVSEPADFRHLRLTASEREFMPPLLIVWFTGTSAELNQAGARSRSKRATRDQSTCSDVQPVLHLVLTTP